MEKYPAIRFLIFIIIGGSIGLFFRLPFMYVIGVSLLSLLLLYFQINTFVKYLLLSISAGLLLSFNIEKDQIDYPDKVVPTFDGVFSGEVDEIIVERKNYLKFKATGTFDSKLTKALDEISIIFTVFNNEGEIDLKPGYKVLTNCTYSVPKPKILPYDFDEVNYLKGESAQFYAIANQRDIAVLNRDYNFSTYLYDIRKDISNSIYELDRSSKSAGVIKALTTGDKSGISKEVREDFSTTGTAHVLAISGLHVGIFSMFIYALLGFVRSRYLKATLFIILIYAFVLVTGGQPSAVRAATMASLAVILILSGRIVRPLNVIAVTGLLYIIFNPSIIYSISFQLSMFAITGIALLYSPIYNLLKQLVRFDNWPVRFTIGSITISLSATIPTAILTTYYFNVYSIIYPIANLFIVPMMSFVAFQSMLFVFTNVISTSISELFLNSAVLVTDWSLKINNYFASIEWSHIKDHDLFLIAMAASAILAYVFVSNNLRKFTFRFSCSMISILLLISFKNGTKRAEEVFLLPREQFTAVISETDKEMNVIISDRKDYRFLKSDYGIEKMIENTNKQINFYKTGLVSINMADKYKHLDNFTGKFISLKTVDRISEKLGVKPVYYLIKYK